MAVKKNYHTIVGSGQCGGRDAIGQGLKGMAVGIMLVLGFMMLYYRKSGFVASAAVLFNLLDPVGWKVGVVRVERFTASYWARRFVGARRIETTKNTETK